MIGKKIVRILMMPFVPLLVISGITMMCIGDIAYSANKKKAEKKAIA